MKRRITFSAAERRILRDALNEHECQLNNYNSPEFIQQFPQQSIAIDTEIKQLKLLRRKLK